MVSNVFDFDLIWSGTGVLIGSMPNYSNGRDPNQYVIGYWTNRFNSYPIAVDNGNKAGFNSTYHAPDTGIDVAAMDADIAAVTSPSRILNFDGKIYPIFAEGGQGPPGILVSGVVTLTAEVPFLTLGGAFADNSPSLDGSVGVQTYAVNRAQVKALVPLSYQIFERSRATGDENGIPQTDPPFRTLFKIIATGVLSMGQILDIPIASILKNRGGPGLPCITNGQAVIGVDTLIIFQRDRVAILRAAGLHCRELSVC